MQCTSQVITAVTDPPAHKCYCYTVALHVCVVPENINLYSLQGGLLEIARVRRSHKSKLLQCKEKYLNQNWNFQKDGGRGGFK